MIPINCLLDTDAGPNLMVSRFIPPNCRSRIKSVVDAHLSAATRQLLNDMGVILFKVRMGELRLRTCFGIVQKLAVPVMLRTSSMDRFVKGILPP